MTDGNEHSNDNEETAPDGESSSSSGRSREYYRQQDPVWLPDADADRIVSYYTLSFTRYELVEDIASTAGFQVDDDRDRFTKEQLAQILVWMRAVEGDL